MTYHDVGYISELEEQVLTLLEDAGIPTTTNDAIMQLISDAQIAQWENAAEARRLIALMRIA